MTAQAAFTDWWPADFIKPWLNAQQTLLETLLAAPQVMAIRLGWLSTHPFFWTATQVAEACRMVTEKHEAMNTGMLAMSNTLGRGLLDPINSVTLAPRLLSAALSPAHREVHSNLSRLEQHSRPSASDPER